MKDGQLPRERRKEIQSRLLEEWCLIDLEAALHASLSEEELNHNNFLDSFLSNSCDAGISADPDLTWELIQRRAFGPDTSRVRRSWIKIVACSTPIVLVDRIDELPPESRWDALRSAAYELHRGTFSTEQKDEVIAGILALPGTFSTHTAEETLLDGMTLGNPWQTFREELLLPRNPEIHRIYLQAYASLYRGLLFDKEKEKFKALPPKLRAEVEAALEAEFAK